MRSVLRRTGLRGVLALLLGAVSTLAAGAIRWSGTSDGLRVTVTDEDVVAADSKGTRLFSLREFFPNFESDDPDVDTQSAIYRPLSLVGPYLSLERQGSSFTPGAAHAAIDNAFVTLDLRKRERPVSLTRWFTEEQLLSALKKDPFLAQQSRLPLSGMSSLEAFASAFARLNDCHLSIVDGRMESFAFYALKEGGVAVRFGIPNSCLSDNQIRQLALVLPIPPSLEDHLQSAASRRHGFLMKDSRKLFGGEFWISFSDKRAASRP